MLVSPKIPAVIILLDWTSGQLHQSQRQVIPMNGSAAYLESSAAAYNSAENAADVADLRRALGVSEWNLYGVSYGTRLALTIMRDQPEGVRSAILDSVCLPQADHYAEMAGNAERAFDLLFNSCAEDDACAEAFTDLETVFWDLVNHLDTQPVVFSIRHPLTW